MQLDLYQIDAFANQAFQGNPAAICPLDEWLDDATMQAIANENNLSETAFFVGKQPHYHIRWFTPTQEVDLCGHATLASAYVIFRYLATDIESVEFQSRSGPLLVERNQDLLSMDFPSQAPQACETPTLIQEAFNHPVVECLKAEDYMVVFEQEKQIRDAQVDLHKLSQLDLRGVCITAIGEQVDFVSRFFAPKYGINEDPVTGSAFTQLIPYWRKQFGQNKLHAKQLSPRGGEVWCEDRNNRVIISGKCHLYLLGKIEV